MSALANAAENEIPFLGQPGPFAGMFGIEDQRIGAGIAGFLGHPDAEAIDDGSLTLDPGSRVAASLLPLHAQ